MATPLAKIGEVREYQGYQLRKVPVKSGPIANICEGCFFWNSEHACPQDGSAHTKALEDGGSDCGLNGDWTIWQNVAMEEN